MTTLQSVTLHLKEADRRAWKFYRGGGLVIGLMLLYYAVLEPVVHFAGAALRGAVRKRTASRAALPAIPAEACKTACTK